MRLILVLFLGAAAITAPATAQSVPEICAELRAKLNAINREASGEWSNWGKASHAQETARRRLQALEGAAEHPVFTALLDEEPFSAKGMLRFREEHALSGDLVSVANSGRPREFWLLAEAELTRTIDRMNAVMAPIVKRETQLSEEYGQLNCARLSTWPAPPSGPRPPAPPASGPLPVERRADGQPVITDALITRWVKARYALANTGGAYWQAGQMTQQDYADVDRRMQLYLDLLRAARMAEQFSDAEMRAVNARWPDIDNTIKGNWSELLRLQ